ncbi:MAG: hypothetical protein IPO18_09270 [bacterium]|nr:hypothetical protein [bacterium]
MPATWLTYLADYQLGGGTPGAFHRTNIALHVASTLLLYYLLRRLAGAVWRPALVAALFAIHPLHVESVAWVAERKDVLSGFFFLLALLPHAKPEVAALSPRARLFSLLCFAVALMSKPMVVTLPVVLLLLDFRQPGQRPALRRLLVEKLPYLALAAAVSAITWQLVQTRDIGGPAPLALPARLAQAIGYCALYLERAVWPTGLSVSYPPEGLLFTPAQVVLAAGALAAASWLAWRGRNQRRLVWLGWLWFLVMLLPVLDLVQGPIAAAAVVAVAVLGWVAHRQVQVWRDSRTLFSHAVAVNDADYLSHLNLGKAFEAEGRLAEALPPLHRRNLHAAPLYLVNPPTCCANWSARTGRRHSIAKPCGCSRGSPWRATTSATRSWRSATGRAPRTSS